MSRFQRVMEENEIARKQTTSVPTYSLSSIGNKKKKKTLLTIKNIFGLSLALVFFAIIYIPQFFMPNESSQQDNETNIIYLQHSLNTMAYFNNGELDYDKDGILNNEELNLQTSMWDIDSDRDGITDYYEINTLKTNPISKDNTLIKIQKELDIANGVSVDSPYQIGNVILWASDYNSKTYGSVIETPTGYRFSNFTGYAQFPNFENIYVYELKNGVRKQIPMREKEQAWKIEGDTEIEIYTEKLREVYKLSFFGNYIYADKELFSSLLNIVLPEKGFVTSQSMTILDIDPDTRDATTTEIQSININIDDYARLTHQDNKIENLAFVRKAIQDNSCIAVSLYSSEYGEYIGLVYGYSFAGDLLIADINTLKHIGVLKIDETSNKIINNSGEPVLYQKYEFSGFGFNSLNGDRISFFAASKSSEDYNSHFSEYNSNLNYETPSLPNGDSVNGDVDFE